MTVQSARSIAFGGSLLALAGLLAFAGYGWVQERDNRVKAEAQTGAQQQQIEALKQRQTQNGRALALQLQSIQKERSRPATASETVAVTNRLMPALPQALQVTSIRDAALPDAPLKQAIVVPEADFQGIRDAQLSCEEDSVKLASCATQQVNLQQQLTLTTAQREEWKTAAKGGSIWHRAVGAAKWFAIGAGTGAVIVAVAHHK